MRYVVRHEKIATIANQVMHCPACKPFSDCILSDLKIMSFLDIEAYLKGLNENSIENILRFHSRCKHKNQVFETLP